MLRSKGTCYISWQEIWNIDLIFLHLPSSRCPDYIVRRVFCICCRKFISDQINSNTVQWEGYGAHSSIPVWPRSVGDVHAHPTGFQRDQYPTSLWFLIVIVISHSWNKGWLCLCSGFRSPASKARFRNVLWPLSSCTLPSLKRRDYSLSHKTFERLLQSL